MSAPTVETASPDPRLSEPMIDRVRNRMASAPTRLSAPEIIAALRAEGCLLADRDLVNAAEQVRSELTGAGVLEALLTDPEVTDVVVNGPNEVWVERSGRLVPTSVVFPDEAAVRRLAQRLAAQAGQRLDDAVPYVDAVLPSGARLHAVLPPVAERGTLISLRVPPRRAYSVNRLVASGMVSTDGGRLLGALVASRASFLISGGTGTGKTTLLGCLLSLVPSNERIVLAEECAEVVCGHPHLVRLQGRMANQEGVGDVGLRTLVRQALRMRPDRVVVGEVRGAEVCDLLAAMNTGHDGGCATVHANGVEEIPARIEALAMSSGIDRASIHAQFAAGVKVVVHLARDGEGVRRMAGVGVVVREQNGFARVVPALAVGPDGRLVRGPGAGRLGELLRVRGAVATSEENARRAAREGGDGEVDGDGDGDGRDGAGGSGSNAGGGRNAGSGRNTGSDSGASSSGRVGAGLADGLSGAGPNGPGPNGVGSHGPGSCGIRSSGVGSAAGPGDVGGRRAVGSSAGMGGATASAGIIGAHNPVDRTIGESTGGLPPRTSDATTRDMANSPTSGLPPRTPPHLTSHGPAAATTASGPTSGLRLTPRGRADMTVAPSDRSTGGLPLTPRSAAEATGATSSGSTDVLPPRTSGAPSPAPYADEPRYFAGGDGA